VQKLRYLLKKTCGFDASLELDQVPCWQINLARASTRVIRRAHKKRRVVRLALPERQRSASINYACMAGVCRKPITCYCVFVVSVFAPSAFAGALLASFALSVLVLPALASTAVFLVVLWIFAV